MTGASGFLGRHALAPLRRLGFEVHAVTSMPVDGIGPTDVHWHRTDLLDAGQSQAVLESVRPTHLLHFAWYAEHGRFWNSPLNLDWISSTLSLLKAFVEAGGKRFVGAGSCAEYDWTERDVYGEKDPLRPDTLYGAAKASAFLTGAAYAETASIEFAWGRIFHLFGPHEAPGRIIPALIRAHLWNEKLDCSQGTQLRDFLPSAAIADAFAHLCDSGGDGGVQGAVNIGSGEAVTLRALSEMIAGKIGQKADIRFGAFQDAGPAKLLPAVHRLHQEVGWRPPISLDTGLEEAIEWWKVRGKQPSA
ncbi:MAG: NAD-dependent epimerase/dehydratase family protein [Fibrobacteria bacterium]